MNPLEELNKIREQNRIRAKRHYNLNKQSVNAKRRANAKILSDLKKGILPPPPIVAPVEQPLPPAPIVLEKVLDLPEVEHILEQLRANDIIKTDGSLKKYMGDLKRLFNTSQCPDLKDCLKNPTEIQQKIESSKYALNTKRDIFSLILLLNTNLNLNYSKKVVDEYKKIFDVMKIKSKNQTIENTKMKVDLFSVYFEKVKEEFEEGSKMGLLIALYDQFTGRDIFQLKISNDNDEAEKDKKVNYLLVSDVKRFRLIINTCSMCFVVYSSLGNFMMVLLICGLILPIL